MALEQTVPPGPQREPTLLMPGLQASGLQNWEEMHFHGSSFQLVARRCGTARKAMQGLASRPRRD